MTTNLLKRNEILKGIENKVKSVILGITNEGLYELDIDTTGNYFSLRGNIYAPFNTEIDEGLAKEYIEESLYCYGMNNNLVQYLEWNGVYLSDMVDEIYENMDEDEKLDLLHSERTGGVEVYYNGEEYMLELVQCGQAYINDFEFIKSEFDNELLENIQRIWNKRHLKGLDSLTLEELEIIDKLFKVSEPLNDMYDYLDDEEAAKCLLREYL